MVASSKLEIKSNVTIEYNPPNMVDLISRAKSNLRVSYTKDNPSRLILISFLENFADFMHRLLNSPDKKATLVECRDIYLGAWLYCIDNIASEYYVSNPEYKDGYIYNSGSTLYKILLNNVGMDKDNQIPEKAKLYYLCKLYNFLYMSKSAGDVSELCSQLPAMKEQLIVMMRNVLVNERNDKNRLMHTIPSEKSIDEGMRGLYQTYIEKAKTKNPERMLLAKLAVIISKHCQRAYAKDGNEYFQILPRSVRVRLGMLIYIMESISNTYSFRSPLANSVLYSSCAEIFGDSYQYIRNETKLACLLALELYLSDERNRSLLEIDFNNNVKATGFFSQAIYVDPVVRDITVNLGKLIEKMTPADSLVPFSKVTLTASALGAIIAAAPGYSAGYAIGYGISLTDQLGVRKRGMSRTTGYAMQVALGLGNCYFGYYAADIFLTAGMERLFAKIFEALAAILGALGAGAVSFIIYDFSFTTAMSLCKLCLHLNNQLPSELVKESDLLFIRTLLELPPEVLSDMDKDKLKKISDTTVSTSTFGFLSQQPTHVEPPLKLQQTAPALLLK